MYYFPNRAKNNVYFKIFNENVQYNKSLSARNINQFIYENAHFLTYKGKRTSAAECSLENVVQRVAFRKLYVHTNLKNIMYGGSRARGLQSFCIALKFYVVFNTYTCI